MTKHLLDAFGQSILSELMVMAGLKYLDYEQRTISNINSKNV